MSIVSEISRLIVKSNTDYVKSFIHYYKRNNFTDIDDAYNSFTTQKFTTDNVQPQRCVYVFTKGPKNNQKCNVLVKTGGSYCSKHKKVQPVKPTQEEDVLQVDLENISDEEASEMEEEDIQQEDDCDDDGWSTGNFEDE